MYQLDRWLPPLPFFLPLPDILHHSQQDLKNRVSQPKIKGLTISHSQETRFFTQVQDVSYLPDLPEEDGEIAPSD